MTTYDRDLKKAVASSKEAIAHIMKLNGLKTLDELALQLGISKSYAYTLSKGILMLSIPLIDRIDSSLTVDDTAINLLLSVQTFKESYNGRQSVKNQKGGSGVVADSPISNILDALKRINKWTWAELAKKAKVSSVTIDRWVKMGPPPSLKKEALIPLITYCTSNHHLREYGERLEQAFLDFKGLPKIEEEVRPMVGLPEITVGITNCKPVESVIGEVTIMGKKYKVVEIKTYELRGGDDGN